MAADWFRRSTWSAEDERAFFGKLAKARSRNRAQYLRIQADHLASADPPLHREALALLAHLVAHCPEPFEMSATHQQIARSFAELGQVKEARDHYRQSLQWMRDNPSPRNQAWAEFALLVALHRLSDGYEEALDLLEEFDGDIMVPVDLFNRHAARALILSDSGQDAAAREEAAAALEAAAVDDSGFRYHPRVGLVGAKQGDLVRRMKSLAESPRGFLHRIIRLLR